MPKRSRCFLAKVTPSPQDPVRLGVALPTETPKISATVRAPRVMPCVRARPETASAARATPRQARTPTHARDRTGDGPITCSGYGVTASLTLFRVTARALRQVVGVPP